MPAKSVLQYRCGRCPRTWYEEKETEEGRPPSVKGVLEFGDGSSFRVEFDALCPSCAATVKHCFESMNKTMKNSSPKRGAKKENES